MPPTAKRVSSWSQHTQRPLQLIFQHAPSRGGSALLPRRAESQTSAYPDDADSFCRGLVPPVLHVLNPLEFLLHLEQEPLQLGVLNESRGIIGLWEESRTRELSCKTSLLGGVAHSSIQPFGNVNISKGGGCGRQGVLSRSARFSDVSYRGTLQSLVWT